ATLLLSDGRVEDARVLPLVGIAEHLNSPQASENGLVVVSQSLRIVVDDLLELWQARFDLEQLVDLLLVFNHHEARVAVIDDELQLMGDGVLEEPDRGGAGRLNRQLSVEPFRAIVADDRDLFAGLQAEGGKTEAQTPDVVEISLPGDCLPDTEIFL